MEEIGKILSRVVSLIIWAYRLLIRPILKPCCRFYPSCSEYALNSLSQHGFLKGSFFACCRLLRCNPWAEGGYDPVSPNQEKK